MEFSREEWKLLNFIDEQEVSFFDGWAEKQLGIPAEKVDEIVKKLKELKLIDTYDEGWESVEDLRFCLTDAGKKLLDSDYMIKI